MTVAGQPGKDQFAAGPIADRADAATAEHGKAVSLLLAFYRAFNAGDIDGALTLMATDFEWFPAFGRGLYGSNAYYGHDGFRQYLADIADVFSEYRVEVLEIEAVGGCTVLSNRTLGRAIRSDILVDQDFTIVYTIADGQLVRGQTFRDRDDALRSIDPAIARDPASAGQSEDRDRNRGPSAE